MGVIASCHQDAQSQLLLAIGDGDLKYVKFLLSTKPKLVNCSLSSIDLSPLHYAASHGQSDVVSLLLTNGALMDALNQQKQTPLMLACKNSKLDCIELLLQAGANILLFDSLHGRSCLHYVAKSGNLQCLQRILDAAQSPSVMQTWGFARFVNVRDGNGATALHIAARYCHADVVRMLLTNRALVSSTTTKYSKSSLGFGSTPLHFAARGGSAECVKELLAWGADRLQRNSQGHTPFLIAMKYNNKACAALLNPMTAEPMVWPSPWKFMNDLEPEAKFLLETALAQANDAWEKRAVFANYWGETSVHNEFLQLTDETEEFNEDQGSLCCICFEHPCTIEVGNCGHQMCAGCTLALCCHNKPNPVLPRSPAPVCPFCRCDILKLRRARPKDDDQNTECCAQNNDIVEDINKDSSKASVANWTQKVSDGATSNTFIGLMSKGSFRFLPSARASCRVADIDWSGPSE